MSFLDLYICQPDIFETKYKITKFQLYLMCLIEKFYISKRGILNLYFKKKNFDFSFEKGTVPLTGCKN